MSLLRNRKTGSLIEVNDLEATILSSPDAFRDWVNKMLAEKKYNASIDLFTNIDSEMIFNLQHGTIPVKDILSGDLDIVPNTKASRLLYGSKK